MKNITTIKEIGQMFADNGYIMSSFGIEHYNPEEESFDYISDIEVMEIFTRIYPNFERKPLNIDMIKEHLPIITDGDFYVYEKCKEVSESNYSEDKYNKEVKKLLRINHDRKKKVPVQFPGDDYNKCIQFLINNDVFSNYETLYQYTDGDFKPFGIYEIRPLMKDHLSNTMQNKDYFKILSLAKHSLTNVDDLTSDINIRSLINILSPKDWKTYERIIEIMNKTKEVQGVKENEYPLCSETNEVITEQR